MKANELPMRGLDDARLAIHAASAFPAWLWSVDGAHMVWVNPVGARLFGAERASDLTAKTFGPADAHRRQIAQLAARLRADGPPRLERLRGFGAPLGRLLTCNCMKLTLADGREAILIAAVEALGRPMPLTERLQRLVRDADIPLAAFGRDGAFVGASDTARTLLGFRDLSEAGLDSARDAALKTGRTETPVGIGHLVLRRVGSGADIGLIALLDACAVPVPVARAETAPPPFALFDEMADFGEDETPRPDAPMPTDDAADAETAPDDLVGDDASADVADEVAEETIPLRTQPLRFLWEIDARERFAINSDELQGLVGPQAAATLDGPWQDVASAYAPYGRMAAAIASRAAWAGISLALPADLTDEPLMADLSGIPTYADGEFTGYRGFGVVNDLEALTRLETSRRRDTDRGPAPQSLSAHTPSSPLAMDSRDVPEQNADEPETAADESLANVDTPANVVHFRSSPDGNPPVLTPVENNAFNELARELSARLEAEHAVTPQHGLAQEPGDANAPLQEPTPAETQRLEAGAHVLLDATSSPIAVHRDGYALYANAAFLANTGHADLAALQAARFDPDALLHAKHLALEWDGEAAEGLIADAPQTAAGAPGAATAEDLGAILDAAEEAVVMFDADGVIGACNRSAAKLFGVHGDTLAGHDLASLFTADTQVAITPLRERLATSTSAQTVEARTIVGGVELPLKLTLGRARPDGPNFYAIIRDLSPQKAGEAELVQARRRSERANADKADLLARISHEMRAPLGAIIGFADVMIEQRFGPLGSDRYADYLRDIRGCGERVVAIVDDLLDLSRIESGKRDLAPAPQDLNTLVEQCVLAMQPEANRERIIIRSSLAHPLPQIVADGAALRQITLNLIGNSIHLANPGGQVIVSTVHADSGDVLLRVRDTGHGLNDNEVATALAPFRPASDDGDTPALIRLSLTRALAEANRARFTVKPAPYAGTLIEVAFPLGQASR